MCVAILLIHFAGGLSRKHTDFFGGYYGSEDWLEWLERRDCSTGGISWNFPTTPLLCITECHRLIWRCLITSGIFWLHVLSCIIYHRQLYWGRQKVGDSVLFDDVWGCLLLHVSEGTPIGTYRYQIVPFGWCTRRNLYGSQEWTDPLSFSGSVWGKGYLPLGWWSHGTIRLSIQE